MAQDQSSEDRTEAATQRHLDQARDQGQVPVSREMVTFCNLTAVSLVLILGSQAMVQRLRPDLVALLSHAWDEALLAPAQLHAVSLRTFAAVIPCLVAGLVAGSAAVLVQTRLLLNLSALTPKMSRVSPAAGIKRIVGFNGLVEVGKSLGKLGLLGCALWIALRGSWGGLARLPWQDPHGLASDIARPLLRIFIAGICVQGVVAAADMGWVRFRHARDLRMSKQDIRDEMKDTEGNPHVKARIHRIRVMRARKRMMAKVPTATVVITNPTHYAVALAYDRAVNPAPRIVAKGTDSLAARIRQVAEVNGVPIVANPPLARSLYRLDLDLEIPEEHFKAVAEIIAYVWRLRRPGGAVL